MALTSVLSLQAQDFLTVGPGSPCTYVETISANIPVHLTDVPGTPLDAGAPAGNRITGFALAIEFAPAHFDAADIALSGLLAGLTPRYVRSAHKTGQVSVVASYDDAANSIPFTGGADEIATLTITPKRQSAPPGTIFRAPLGFASSSVLANLDGTIVETVGETLIATNGCIATAIDFLDVAATHPFRLHINRLLWKGITSGCASGYYCPQNGVTRGEIAIFLLRSKHGANYVPPPATGTVFNDVPINHPFAAWIEQLKREEVTSGCGGGNYCPDASVSRAEVAAFLLRQLEGPGFVPPAATGLFVDVPVESIFAPWIEELSRRAITSGCSAGHYCPGEAVTRGQVAVFLGRTFGF